MKKILLVFFILLNGISGWGQCPVLTILHTNDTHSQIEPHDTKERKNVGGVLRRNTYIEEIRSQKTPLLLLDAGDFSQGTPYFNFFKGYAEIELMNKMGYDVVTLGNHEFDNGVEALGKRLIKARFKVVCANYTFNDKKLSRKVKPYVIVKKRGLKIGIFGLTVDLQGLVSPAINKDVKYHNAIETARVIVPELKRKKCDLIICLSHLGITQESEHNNVNDSTLAVAVGDIDIIVGGHTHYYMAQPKIINGVRILQLNNGGMYIGKLDIYNKDEE